MEKQTRALPEVPIIILQCLSSEWTSELHFCGSTQLAGISFVHPSGLWYNNLNIVLTKMFCGDPLGFSCGSPGVLPVGRCFRQSYVSMLHKSGTWSHVRLQSKGYWHCKAQLFAELKHWWVLEQCQPHLIIQYVSTPELQRDPEELTECQGERYPLDLVSRGRNVFSLGYKYGKLLEHTHNYHGARPVAKTQISSFNQLQRTGHLNP